MSRIATPGSNNGDHVHIIYLHEGYQALLAACLHTLQSIYSSMSRPGHLKIIFGREILLQIKNYPRAELRRSLSMLD